MFKGDNQLDGVLRCSGLCNNAVSLLHLSRRHARAGGFQQTHFEDETVSQSTALLWDRIVLRDSLQLRPER